MCFAVPVQVLEVLPGGARVARGDAEFAVTTCLLDAAVSPGDWLAVQAQRDAMAILTPQEVEEMLSLYDEIARHLEEAPQ